MEILLILVYTVRITGHGRALGLDPGSLDPMEKVSWKQLNKTKRSLI
jgi:hypothetical protein